MKNIIKSTSRELGVYQLWYAPALVYKLPAARPLNDTALNGGPGYLLDVDKEGRVFNNQSEADAFLLADGFISGDVEFLYLEVVDDGLQADCRERGICPDTKGE